MTTPVHQALTILGDAIRFIDGQRPDLRSDLVELLGQWAAMRKIPVLKLIEHVGPVATERAAQVDKEIDQLIAELFRSNG